MAWAESRRVVLNASQLQLNIDHRVVGQHWLLYVDWCHSHVGLDDDNIQSVVCFVRRWLHDLSQIVSRQQLRELDGHWVSGVVKMNVDITHDDGTWVAFSTIK